MLFTTAAATRTVGAAGLRTVGVLRTPFGTRAKSTFFPPNVASLKELGKFESSSPSAHPIKLRNLQTLYAKLPKQGSIRTLQYDEFKDKLSLRERYNAKYYGRDSLVPIFHGMLGFIALFYYIQYRHGPHYHPHYEFH